VRVRDVRRAAVRLRWRGEQYERRRNNQGKAERIAGCRHEHVCRDDAAGFVLMIDYRSGGFRNDGVVTREMRMLRLPVMVRRLFDVEMHVTHRRGDGADLHEDDERGGGQPAKHTRIVVNRAGAPHLTFP